MPFKQHMGLQDDLLHHTQSEITNIFSSLIRDMLTYHEFLYVRLHIPHLFMQNQVKKNNVKMYLFEWKTL